MSVPDSYSVKWICNTSCFRPCTWNERRKGNEDNFSSLEKENERKNGKHPLEIFFLDSAKLLSRSYIPIHCRNFQTELSFFQSISKTVEHVHFYTKIIIDAHSAKNYYRSFKIQHDDTTPVALYIALLYYIAEY